MLGKIDLKNSKMVLIFIITLGVLIGIGGYTFWYGYGYSYFTDDPIACANCHVMRDSLKSWSVSTHRSVTCNGCHVPKNPIRKWISKVKNGIRHSIVFTFEDVEVLRITQKNLHNLQENCIHCHEPMVSMIMQRKQETIMSCTHCHQGVGHVF